MAAMSLFFWHASVMPKAVSRQLSEEWANLRLLCIYSILSGTLLEVHREMLVCGTSYAAYRLQLYHAGQLVHEDIHSVDTLANLKVKI